MTGRANFRHLQEILDKEDWEEEASCKKYPTEVFFPEWEDRNTTALAKSICQACPVLDQCTQLAFAIPSSWKGIWAGMSRMDRLALRGIKVRGD